MITDQGILYIEPSDMASAEPVIDELTQKMTAAFRSATDGVVYRGVHQCRCGAVSSNREHVLPNGEETNSLCIHYLAFHRAEVPAFQLEKVRRLDCGEAKPTAEEIQNPATGTWSLYG